MEASHSGKENKRRRKGGKKNNNKGEGRGGKKKAYSLQSLCEKSETPGALDRHGWESQEANLLPRTVLLASVHMHYQLPAFWL